MKRTLRQVTAVAVAQTQTGDITGRVLDSSGAALPGVTVTIDKAACRWTSGSIVRRRLRRS